MSPPTAVEWPVVRLGQGESAVFGYGSLISRASMERTLGRPYDGPFVACAVDGWRRTWDVVMPNHTRYTDTPSGRLYPGHILYLNVRPEAGRRLNGMLFVVGPDELGAMDQREWIYDRVAITGALHGVRVEGGDAFIYVAKPEYTMREVPSPDVAAIRSTYLDIVEDGLRSQSGEFRREYQRSSDAVPRHLVIDDLVDPAPDPTASRDRPTP